MVDCEFWLSLVIRGCHGGAVMVQKSQNKWVALQPGTLPVVLGAANFNNIDEIVSRNHTWLAGWWFQPIWKILVKLGIFPNFRGENKIYLKPPPRWIDLDMNPSIASSSPLIYSEASLDPKSRSQSQPSRLRVFTLRGCSPSSRELWHWTCDGWTWRMPMSGVRYTSRRLPCRKKRGKIQNTAKTPGGQWPWKGYQYWKGHFFSWNVENPDMTGHDHHFYITPIWVPVPRPAGSTTTIHPHQMGYAGIVIAGRDHRMLTCEDIYNMYKIYVTGAHRGVC